MLVFWICILICILVLFSVCFFIRILMLLFLVNLIVFFIRLVMICCNCSGLLIMLLGMLFLILSVSFNFLLWEECVSRVMILFSVLCSGNGIFFRISLFVFSFEKLRILLIIVSKLFVECLIVFRWLCCVGVNFVFSVRWVKLIILFSGVCSLCDIFVRNLDLICVVFWVCFFVRFNLMFWIFICFSVLCRLDVVWLILCCIFLW